MKWYRFWVKSSDVDIQDYLEIPDQVAASPALLKKEFSGWVALRALGANLRRCKKGYEDARRPPVGWLIEKAATLKEQAKIMAEKASRYKALAEDKGGRREPSQVTWLAGTLFSDQKREAADRRKGKKA